MHGRIHPNKKERLSLCDAQNILFSLPMRRCIETVALDQAMGRILAETVHAPEDVPPFPRAPLDGYAFLAFDSGSASEENPVTLKVIGTVAAGDGRNITVHKGEAVRIMTGAPFPEQADTMLRLENTEFTETEVKIFDPMEPGINRVPAGDDVRKGNLIASAGIRITPPLAGLLAAVNHIRIKVFQKPVVTIISTGNEIEQPGANSLPYGKIRNSSFYTLGGYALEAGADLRFGGVVPDQTESIAAALEKSLEVSDLLITTGGVSAGDYDMVRSAADAIGAKQLFWKVRFRPGGTLLAAEKNGKLILGLSGNPASAALGMQLLGLPFLRKLAGLEIVLPRRIQATMLRSYEKESPYGRLIRGRLVIVDGIACFDPLPSQGNGAVTSLLNCDLIADIPRNTAAIAKGTVVEAYWL
ncbi:MAG: molybdopterin molybdotransferase MoeA [Oscillospiraceae bacterium]|nr:molybdopterin molybdotransferase MoeA [Oscillospiraceae bacterium]